MSSLHSDLTSLLAGGEEVRASRLPAASRAMGRAMQLREAALLFFCDPLPAECALVMALSRREWKELSRWLDTSGLALYFLDRLCELNMSGSLPADVAGRLKQNLSNNSQRIEFMIAESASIQSAFQKAGVSYAVLKGFSLWPVSVPRLELRSQLDLDFLVSEESADQARQILEEAGYRLRASDGRNLDFSAGEEKGMSLKSMYEAGRVRSAELHIESVPVGQASLLSRTEKLRFRGLDMPVLPALDLFLGQGLHLYKHVCSQFARAAHLIEFRRHVIARHDEVHFWQALERQCAAHPQARIRLGVVLLLITRVMGRFAPEALTCWTVDQLPPAVQLWVDRYGSRIALAGFPGTKLYLLLEQELEASGLPRKRSLRHALLPRRLPQSIAVAVPGESLRACVDRHLKQFRFNLLRLRFSSLEGIRFCFESMIWKRAKGRLTQ